MAALVEARRGFGGFSDWVTFVLLTAGGGTLLLRNMAVTSDAVHVFAQDVFDSNKHILCFRIAKVYLAIVWLFLYPLVVTLALRALRVLVVVIRGGVRSRSLHVDFFGPDDCGGMLRIGRVYYKVLLVGLLFSACSFASFMTHRSYRPQITVLAIASFFVGVISYFLSLRPLHRYVVAERRVPLSRIVGQLNEAYDNQDWSRCSNLIAIRAELLAINTYALPTSEAVIVLLITFVQLTIAAWVVVAAPPMLS